MILEVENNNYLLPAIHIRNFIKDTWNHKSPQFQGLGPLKSSLILVIHTFTDKSMCNEKFVSIYSDRRSEKKQIENDKTNNGSNGSIRHHNRAIIRTYMRHSTIAYVLCFEEGRKMKRRTKRFVCKRFRKMFSLDW